VDLFKHLAEPELRGLIGLLEKARARATEEGADPQHSS
jgi:hypothetical protein